MLLFIMYQCIAGRHLSRLQSSLDLSKFSLSLGDIWDLEECIARISEKPPTEIPAPIPSSSICTPPSQVNVSLSNSGAINCSVETVETPSVEEEDKTVAEEEENEEPNDKEFEGFATRDEIRKMTLYQRNILRNEIEKYNYLRRNGIHCKKPTVFLASSDEGSPPPKRQKNPKSTMVSAGSRGGEKSCTAGPSGACKSVLSSCDGNIQQQSSNGSKSKRSKTKKITRTILQEHEAFLSDPKLDVNQRALIKHHLECPTSFVYKLSEILTPKKDSENDEDDNDDETSYPSDQYKMLCRDGILFGKDLQTILQHLVNHLYLLAGNIKLVTPEMREGLAVSLVATYPKLAQEIIRPDDKPWTYIFNRESNTGKIACIVQQKQRNQKGKRARGGGTEKRKRKAKPPVVAPLLSLCVPENTLSKDAKYLKLLVGSDVHKDVIREKMECTFEERRALIMSGKYHITAILQVFPHLKSFQGEMIDLDFGFYHKGKENLFLCNFSDIVPKVLHLAETCPEKYESCVQFDDDFLNSLVILSKFLPKPKRMYPWEAKMSPNAVIGDVLEVKPHGTNIQHEIERKREKSKHPVQPYLLAIGTKDKFDSLCLVLGDSASIQLPRDTQPARAIDLLIKVHYVLDVPFVLGWKNVLRFIAVHIFKILPRSDKVSVFTAEWLQLCQER